MRKLKTLQFRIKKRIIKRYWRKKNKHNRVFLGNISNIEAIDFIKSGGVIVGKNTYGTINVNYTLGEKEKLIIGSNCSLGRCEFLLGGEHNHKCFSTFPFSGNVALSKGPIVVEDEVWIGDGVWVLSGVTIGKGAVVGTGSIVTKDVPPYAIVAGNPARVIKYRFSQSVIDKLKALNIEFDKLSKKQLELLDTYYISEETIDDFIEKIID